MVLENKENQQEKKNEEIIVDLKSKEENDAVSNLSKEEQDKIKVISDKLREELGIDEEQAKEKREQLQKEQQEKQQEQAQEQESKDDKDNYSGFIKKYSKKEESAESMSAGKYDSDLDFKINRKIKRVFLPLPKRTKIILSAVAGVVFIGLVAAVAVALYKPPVPVTLASVAITQPTKITDGKTYYLVRNVNVGDAVSYENIFLDCKYSDGSIKKIPINSSMTKLLTNGAVVAGKFVQDGNVDYQVRYEGKTMTLRFVVKENLPETLSVFPANFNAGGTACLQVEKNHGTVDLTNRLIVKCTYADGSTKMVNIADCKFAIDSTSDSSAKKLTDNMLDYALYNTGEHYIYVSYEETLANGSTNKVSCQFMFYIVNTL